MSVALEAHSVAEEPDASREISIGFYLACRRPHKADAHGSVIVEYTSLLLGELGADIKKILRLSVGKP